MDERPRDCHGITVYQPFARPGDGTIRVSDALLIGELDSTYVSADNKNLHLRKGERLVISTPNADYLPYVNLGTQVISMCVDGRWGAEDWAQWPQWHFDGQEHFPYILRKPAVNVLDSHPLRRLWYNISESDFQLDPSSKSFGMLIPKIAEELYGIRTNLMKEVEACVCSHGLDYQNLHSCATKMRHCVSTLRFTPQPFTGVHLTTVAAQRYCLELRAMLDRIAIGRKSLSSSDSQSISSSGGPPVADNTRLGCITDRVPVLCELHEKGISVWYVRPSSEVSLSTTIVMQSPVIRPANRGIETKHWPGAPIFYQGPLSRQIHAGIEQWKPGNLQLNLLGRGSESESAASEVPPQKSNKKLHSSEPYSKEKAVARMQLKKPNISVNLDLFKDLDKPYFPKLINSWKKALTEVKIDIMRVIDHPDVKLFRGFAFPPRSIFCGDDEQRNLEHMLGWLVVRSSWMSSLSDSSHPAPLPNAQQWRTYLRGVALDLELLRLDNRHQASEAPAVDASRSTRRGGKLKEAAKAIFVQVLPKKEDVQVLMWNDQVVWRHMGGLDFSTIGRQQLIWDTEEHNFRAELTTLDHLIMKSMWDTDEGSKIRSQKVGEMWPDGGTASLSLPSESTGVAAEYWLKRCAYVEAFQSIVMDWPGHIPRLLAQLPFSSTVNGQNHWDQSMMEKVEGLAARHYCQAFFDHFGRAPCLPRIFPVS